MKNNVNYFSKKKKLRLKKFILGSDSEPKSKRRLFEGKTSKEGTRERLDERDIRRKGSSLLEDKQDVNKGNEGKRGNNFVREDIVCN